MAKNTNIWEKNFASNEQIVSSVRKEIIPRIRQVRLQRENLEQYWLRFFNMWNVTKDDNHSYSGRANLYVPEVRKNVEAQARQFTELAFPTDDPFYCSPYRTGSRRGADLQRSIRTWQIREANLKLKYHVFARQECLYGTSPVRVDWSRKTERVLQSARDPKTGKIKLTKNMVELFNGPDFMVRDLFNWFVFNPNSNDMDDNGCFEDIVVSRDDLNRMRKELKLMNLDEIDKGMSRPYLLEELNKRVQRAESLGLQVENQGYAGTAILREEDKDYGRELLQTLVYSKMVCPKEMYLDDEDPSLAIPVEIRLFNSTNIASVRRNPFFHQRPPYLIGKYIPGNANEFYGQGIPWATQYQQYELNSKAEQAMDSATLALNPIAIIDPALASQTGNFEIEPGAAWYANPAGVKFSNFTDVSGSGYNAMGIIKAQMQDYSDRSPALPPQLLGKSRSATQSGIVNSALNTDLSFFQTQNELMVLQPLMKMWDSLTDQYADEDQIIMILGDDAKDWHRQIIKKSALVGDYMYFWDAAKHLGQKEIMARQMIDAMKVAGSLPPEVQAKMNFNFAEAFITVFRDLWNLPNSRKILSLPEEMKSQSPEVELKMLKLGMDIEVLPQDNDQAHIAEHDKDIKAMPDGYMKDVLIRHSLAHIDQVKKKAQFEQEMKQRAMVMQQMAAAQMNQPPNKGGRMRGQGNRTQLSPNANTGNMGSGIRP